jgi:hypothetical protein
MEEYYKFRSFAFVGVFTNKPPCQYDVENVKQHSDILQTEVHPVLVGDNTNKGGKRSELNPKYVQVLTFEWAR